MYGSESVPKEAFDNWQLVEKLPWVIGDFVWTGMDYIGESGIGNSIYPKSGKERVFLMPWPTYISWCGDIDIIGNKKPQSYYRDILWGESNLEILVHEPNTSGVAEVTSFWGWPNEVPGWSWEGHEEELLDVNVYSKYPEVRLEFNGEVVGKASVSEETRYTASFKVPYQPGVLKAIGINNNEDKDEKVIRSASELANLELIAEQEQIEADRAEIVYIEVEALDKDGILVDTSSEELNVSINGPAELLAAGNANPILDGSIQDHTFKLFRGKGLIVVRSTGTPGDITVSLESEAIPEGNTTITAN